MWFAAYLTMVNCLGDLAVLYVIDKKPYFSAQKCVQSPPMESASTGIVICLREASYLISIFKYQRDQPYPTPFCIWAKMST